MTFCCMNKCPVAKINTLKKIVRKKAEQLANWMKDHPAATKSLPLIGQSGKALLAFILQKALIIFLMYMDVLVMGACCNMQGKAHNGKVLQYVDKGKPSHIFCAGIVIIW